MALTALVLVLFRAVTPVDVASYSAALPFESMGGVIVAGIFFTLVNATLEELVFRGILFDALESQWGKWFTLVVTALLFGLGHLRGYPSGGAGAGLAVMFGLVTGGLRLWTGGLALPMLAHLGADATIYIILARGCGVRGAGILQPSPQKKPGVLTDARPTQTTKRTPFEAHSGANPSNRGRRCTAPRAAADMSLAALQI